MASIRKVETANLIGFQTGVADIQSCVHSDGPRPTHSVFAETKHSKSAKVILSATVFRSSGGSD